MSRFLLLFLFSLLLNAAIAQTGASKKPCSSPECSQFDFWVGEWNLTWNDSLKGTNSVKHILEGCAVQENFKDPKHNFNGMSWSMYDPKAAIWQQTWVDNQQGYIVLKGKFEKGEMTLTTEPSLSPQGKQSVFRMIFYNIKPASFDWNWEISEDNGNTWKLNWKIHYQRKK